MRSGWNLFEMMILDISDAKASLQIGIDGDKFLAILKMTIAENLRTRSVV